jgi:hypothetical protein
VPRSWGLGLGVYRDAVRARNQASTVAVQRDTARHTVWARGAAYQRRSVVHGDHDLGFTPKCSTLELL